MKRYIVKPPAAGEFGPETICDQNYENFKFVHFLVDHYPEDFIARFPVYLVSEKMLNSLKRHNITYYILHECRVSYSEDYIDFENKGTAFQKYFHIEFPEGGAGRHFEIIDFELVVTELGKEIIQSLSCESTSFVSLPNSANHK